jgi:hypothetical protein
MKAMASTEMGAQQLLIGGEWTATGCDPAPRNSAASH